MINQEKRNLAFISDINQAYYALTNIIFIDGQVSKPIKYNLILSDIPEEDKRKIISFKEKISLTGELEIHWLDTSNLRLGTSNLIHVTTATNIRLYLSSILHNLDNVLYLDNDTIVDGDINELFDYVEPNKSYAAEDSNSIFFRHPSKLKKRGLLKSKNKYFNAGVLFLDLVNIRDNNLEEKMIDFLHKEKISFADQDVLNCNITFETLPWFWNYAKKSLPKNLDENRKDFSLTIFHYLQWAKQWKKDKFSFSSFKKSKNLIKKDWKKIHRKIWDNNLELEKGTLETLNKRITFLIVIHNQFDAIDFFTSYLKSESNHYDVLFAFDMKESDLPLDKRAILDEGKFKLYFNDDNIGKFNTVVNASHSIETPFFKIVDQDDSLDISSIFKLNSELLLIDETSLVKHKASKVFKGSDDIFKQSLDLNVVKEQIRIGKDVHWAQQVNCDTIYPTKVIREIKEINLSRQEFHNDVLLSNYVVGMNHKLEKIESKFYIHLHNAGQTSSLNPKRAECVVELYENYLKIKEAKPDFDFSNLMLGMKISHIFFSKSFTKWYLRDDRGKALYAESKKLIKENIKK